MRSYCLSIHAGYRCQHAGACCTAGWSIPIETAAASVLRTRGVLGEQTLEREEDASGSRVELLRKTASGACACYDRNDGLCGIHRDAGPDLLPVACRNFPRIALHDVRGTFVTLSHFCPTAAGLLVSAGPIAIVEAPAALTLDGGIEGLDARAVLPPLLRSGMLMDMEGYDRWQQEGVAVFNGSGTAAEGLRIVADATRDVCAWSPDCGPLVERVATAFSQARASARQDVGATARPLEHALKAFLAAHLFASWAAYQNGGLMAIVREIELALTLAGSGHDRPDSFIAAVRRADLRLRHTEDHVGSRTLSSLRRR